MKDIYENYINMMDELRARRAAVVEEMTSQYEALDEQFKQLECDETMHNAIYKYLKRLKDCVQYTRSHDSVSIGSEEYARSNFREFEEVKNVLVKLMS